MEVTLQIEDDVALIRLDDGKKNALDLDALKALHGAFDEAEAKAKAVVLAGRPGSFCAGFDMATMLGGDANAARDLGLYGGRMALRLYECGKPVVAACTGHAFTIGALWLLASDTRIGEAGAYKFGMTETKLGVPLGPWAFELLKARIAPTHYVPVVAQSKILDPAGAVAAGFLDELVGEGEAVPAALALARQLAALPARAYATNKLSTRSQAFEIMRSDLDL